MVPHNNFLLVASLVIAQGVVFNTCNADGLRKNFYKNSCPQAENIVRDITWSKVQANPALAAKLLRMHFHDCFVKGCDASILLDPVGANQTEKNAVPNLALAGFDVIDDIKTQLEKTCPGIVSCADILTLSARDAISFQFKKALWDVLTGRRDGNESLASNTIGNIPSPFSDDFTTQAQIFAKKGLNVYDLVVLSGAHTIGVARCGTFSRRLYNFTGNGDADPSLNATYAALLRTQCPATTTNTTTTVEMDPQSSLTFDTHYYDILVQKQGLFQSDAALLTNKASTEVVESLMRRSNTHFFTQFGKSMKKMGNIEVLVGTNGQIRKQCRLVN